MLTSGILYDMSFIIQLDDDHSLVRLADAIFSHRGSHEIAGVDKVI
jgi:hypothetical protein